MKTFIKQNRSIVLLVVLFLLLAGLSIGIAILDRPNREYIEQDAYVLIYKHRLHEDNYIWFIGQNDVFLDNNDKLYESDENSYLHSTTFIFYTTELSGEPIRIGAKRNPKVYKSDYSGYYIRVKDLTFELEEGLVYRLVN